MKGKCNERNKRGPDRMLKLHCFGRGGREGEEGVGLAKKFMCAYFQFYHCYLYFWAAQKSLQMVPASMKLKDACSLEEKL